MQAMRTQQSEQLEIPGLIDLGPAPSANVGDELRAAARLGDALLAVTEQQVVERAVVAQPEAPVSFPALAAVKTEALVKGSFTEAKTQKDYEDAARHLSHALKKGASDELRGELFALLDSMIADPARVDFHLWLRRKKARLLLLPFNGEKPAVSAELKKARSVNATVEKLRHLRAVFPDASEAMQANIIASLKLSFIDAKSKNQKNIDRLLDKCLLEHAYPFQKDDKTAFAYLAQQAMRKICAGKMSAGTWLKDAFSATLKEKNLTTMDAMQTALFASLERKLTSSFVTPEQRAALEEVIHDLKNPSPYVLENVPSMSPEDVAQFKEAMKYCGQYYHVWGEKRLPYNSTLVKKNLRELSNKGCLEADAKLAYLYYKKNDFQRTMRHLYRCYDRMSDRSQALRLKKLKEVCGEENKALYACYEKVLKNALTAKDILDATELQEYIDMMGPALGWETLARQLLETSKTKTGRALLKQCDYSQMPFDNLRYDLARKVKGASVDKFFWNAVRKHADAGWGSKALGYCTNAALIWA